MTDNDRELLERAARAAGVVGDSAPDGTIWMRPGRNNGRSMWNPLADDGDAFRLAVRLELSINFLIGVNRVRASNDGGNDEFADEDFGADPCAATRRAIVRAAAAIGESMK